MCADVNKCVTNAVFNPFSEILRHLIYQLPHHYQLALYMVAPLEGKKFPPKYPLPGLK